MYLALKVCECECKYIFLQATLCLFQTCLPNCQSDKTVLTRCKYPQNDCENDQVLADCPNKDQAKATNKLTKPQTCYHPAVEV